VPVVDEVDSFLKTIDIIIESCDHGDIEEIIICLADFCSRESRDAVYKVVNTQHELDVKFRVYVQHGSPAQTINEITEMIQGSHYIIQPSDLETDPHMISGIIKTAKQKPKTILTGSRFTSGADSSEIASIKKIFYPAVRFLVQRLYSCKLTDTTICYRCVPCEYVKDLVLKETSYAVFFEMMLKFIRLGYPIEEFPIKYKRRTEGTSNVNFFKKGICYIRPLFLVRLQKIESFKGV
jgi:hypothetical protein